MAKQNLSKSQPATQQNLIRADVVIVEARNNLETIQRHLSGLDLLLSELDEGDDWAHAINYGIQAIGTEIGEVIESLGKITMDGKTGAAIGIEKGGAE